jgi:hypothetical protein
VVTHTTDLDDRYDKSARLILATRSRVRRQAPRPYGFAPGTAQPPPAEISWAEDLSARDVLRTVLARNGVLRTVLARSSLPLGSVTLEYGTSPDLVDHVEVKTDFSRRAVWSYPLDEELGIAGESDIKKGRGNTAAIEMMADDFDGPFEHDTSLIVIDDHLRQVETLTYGHYRALRFDQDSLVVTIVSRSPLPERPAFARVTDLEPFLTAVTDGADTIDAIKDWIRSQRPPSTP